MSDNIKSLNKVKAMKSQDSFDWSVEDCLEQMLEDIRSGEINPECVAIHYYDVSKSRERVFGRFHCFYAAKMTYENHIALLEIAKARVIEGWRSDG